MAPLLFITAGVFALFAVVNSQTIKEALVEEGTYSAIVPAVLKTTANTNVSTGVLNLKEPWVQTAAEKAFPANDLEQKANGAIDGTFAWLDGKTERPDFSIDLTPNKTAFADEVGSYAQNRYAGLQPCTRNNLPTSVDPLTINCRVPGVPAERVADTLRQQVLADRNFLADPVISPSNPSLNPVNQTATTDPFEQMEGLRSVYQYKALLIWILPLLIIVSIVAGLLLAPNKIQGMNRLSRSLLVSAVCLALIGFLLGTGLSRLVDTLTFDAITSEVMGPVLTNLSTHARNVYFIFAGLSGVAAIGLFAGGRFMKQRISSNPLH